MTNNTDKFQDFEDDNSDYKAIYKEMPVVFSSSQVTVYGTEIIDKENLVKTTLKIHESDELEFGTPEYDWTVKHLGEEGEMPKVHVWEVSKVKVYDTDDDNYEEAGFNFENFEFYRGEAILYPSKEYDDMFEKMINDNLGKMAPFTIIQFLDVYEKQLLINYFRKTKIPSLYLLTINDIKEWLIDNRAEFQKLKAQEFPPYDNALYWTYNHLYDFIQYYKYKQHCDKALAEIRVDNFRQLSQWTKQYEILGSQDLLMFEVNYIKWDEDVSSDKIKIHEGLYTEREPFANILCFCKIFQHLYWDNNIHEIELTENEKVEVVAELKTILKTYYTDTTHD